MEEEGEWYDDDNSMQLAVALSSSSSLAFSSPAASSFASSSAAASSSAEQLCTPCETTADDDDDHAKCHGSCLGLPTKFLGPPCFRPDPSQPEGGWAYTSCCGRPAHFDCLGRWLNPFDGRMVESTHGPVEMNLVCPFCRTKLARTSTRMMSAEAREV